MHNWLIFQYFRVRAHSKTGVLRGCPHKGRTDRPGGGKRRRDAEG